MLELVSNLGNLAPKPCLLTTQTPLAYFILASQLITQGSRFLLYHKLWKSLWLAYTMRAVLINISGGIPAQIFRVPGPYLLKVGILKSPCQIQTPLVWRGDGESIQVWLSWEPFQYTEKHIKRTSGNLNQKTPVRKQRQMKKGRRDQRTTRARLPAFPASTLHCQTGS